MKITRYDFPDFKITRMRIDDVFRNLPTWAGNAALNFFLDSWQRQGWFDSGLSKWEPRKKADTKRGNRALLIGSGRLRRSLRLRTGAGWYEVYTDNPYAKIHNEGGTIKQTVTPRQRRYFWAMYFQAKKEEDAAKAKVKIKAKAEEAENWKAMALSKTLTIKIPSRRFMGDSELLTRRIALHVERALKFAIDGRD